MSPRYQDNTIRNIVELERQTLYQAHQQLRSQREPQVVYYLHPNYSTPRGLIQELGERELAGHPGLELGVRGSFPAAAGPG